MHSVLLDEVPAHTHTHTQNLLNTLDKVVTDPCRNLLNRINKVLQIQYRLTVVMRLLYFR